MEEITSRKSDHIRLCLEKSIVSDYNYWDDIKVFGEDIPDFSFDEIDTSCLIFGKRLKAPIIISAITGGFEQADVINQRLAITAERYGIGLGVGSQRCALENSACAPSFNIGAPQIVQPESELVCSGFWKKSVEGVTACPLILKETGSGLSRKTAEKAHAAGFIGFDTGGLSGTSFPTVEYYRAERVNSSLHMRLEKLLWDWGIPAPLAISECNHLGLPVIATGGIRNGLDITRSYS